MSTKWDNYFINGGDFPTLDLPDVPEPDIAKGIVYKYVCWDCGKANDFWYRLCAECDAKLDEVD